MPRTEDSSLGSISLVFRLGNLEVSVVGPANEATSFLNHLQAFGPVQSPPQASVLAPPDQDHEPPRPLRTYTLQASGPSSRVEPEPPLSRQASSSLPASGPLAGVEPESPPRARTQVTGIGNQVPRLHRVEPESPHTPLRLRASPSTTPSGPAVQDHLQASAGSTPLRSEVEAHFPSCPDYLHHRARLLSGSTNISAEARIERAWRAGCWAGEVLRGNFPTPSASVRLDLPSRVYPVLGGPQARPALFRSYRDLARTFGPLGSHQAVFHGFPSETEAEIYAIAAQVPWPL